jgi:hypothetical protein
MQAVDDIRCNAGVSVGKASMRDSRYSKDRCLTGRASRAHNCQPGREEGSVVKMIVENREEHSSGQAMEAIYIHLAGGAY